MADIEPSRQPEPITARVLTLSALFATNRQFRFPHFQRAYAWDCDQVSRLLTNLLEALRQLVERRRYFLGRLLLARPRGADHVGVVDGHQRLITLTILFAVLRDLTDDAAERARLTELLQSSDGASRHLQPAPSLAAFFAEHVQNEGATARPYEGDFAGLSESQANVIANRDLLRSTLAATEIGAGLRAVLCEFLTEHCRVIVHEVEDELEAWSMLQIEEQTRLDFTPTDEAKASILSVMPAADRERCGPIWELWQAKLGAEEIHALLGHIHMLTRRRQTDMPVETELIRHFDLTTNGPDFFTTTFEPRAERLQALRARTIGSAQSQPTIAAAIEHATWLSPQIWVPAALRWLEIRGVENSSTPQFFARLERLVWLLRLSGTDPYIQRSRIIALLGGIDSGAGVGEIKALAIEERMRREALENLRSSTFYAKHYCGHVLRRLSVLAGADPGPIAPGRTTIEHILPRNPPPHSGWMQSFANRGEVHAYANRLGNLTLLSGQRNQEAANDEWPAKQAVFRRPPQHALSMRAAEEPQWTKDTIVRRTEALISMLFEAWELQAP